MIMKKLIPLIALAAGLVLAGCNKNESTPPGATTSSSPPATTSTNAP